MEEVNLINHSAYFTSSEFSGVLRQNNSNFNFNLNCQSINAKFDNLQIFHQKMCIRWGNAVSPSFTVSNSVKQSCIISPILFNGYKDGLSVLLNCSTIGGQIGHTFLNHLCYADDLCLISLSSAGMQKLLNLCSKYTVDHSLTYNAKVQSLFRYVLYLEL